MSTPEQKSINLEDLVIKLLRKAKVGSFAGEHMKKEELEQLKEYRAWLDTIPDDSLDAELHTRHITAFQLIFNVMERIAGRAEIVKLLYLQELEAQGKEL